MPDVSERSWCRFSYGWRGAGTSFLHVNAGLRINDGRRRREDHKRLSSVRKPGIQTNARPRGRCTRIHNPHDIRMDQDGIYHSVLKYQPKKPTQTSAATTGKKKKRRRTRNNTTPPSPSYPQTAFSAALITDTTSLRPTFSAAAARFGGAGGTSVPIGCSVCSVCTALSRCGGSIAPIEDSMCSVCTFFRCGGSIAPMEDSVWGVCRALVWGGGITPMVDSVCSVRAMGWMRVVLVETRVVGSVWGVWC